MANKKVLLFTNILPPYRARFLSQIASELKKDHDTFDIYLSKPSEPGRNWNEKFTELSTHHQKTITLKKTWRHPHGFSEPNYIHIPIDTLAILLREKPTHIISAELGFRTFFTSLYKFLFKRTQLIVWATLSEHTEKGRSFLRTLFRKALLSNVDRVIVNGQSGKRYIASLGFKSENIHAIPQTTDLTSLLSIERSPITEPCGTEDHPLKMLYSGRLIELKGLLPFLNHLQKFLKTHSDFFVEFSFLGDGPLKSQIEKFDFSDNLKINLIGEVQYSELSKYYKNADLLVLPTFSDEWGMVVVEALAAGIPVLGSIYSQAVDELIQEGVNGWRFDPLNENSILTALILVRASADNRMPQNKNTRKTIESLAMNRLMGEFLKVLI